MDTIFNGFVPGHQFLICVDSDGCAMDTMDGVGDAARNAVRDAGDALTGSTTGYTKNHMDGYTYDQMVRNGRVF